MRSRLRSSSSSRLPLAGVALGVVATLSSYALASPADPFAVALPGKDTAAPEGVTGASIDAQVNEQQGAASYAYPIVVPPGRNGMAPHLALSYSSSGALRGGVAVGWSLALPTIELDEQLPQTYRYDGQLLRKVTGDPAGTTYRLVLDRGEMLRVQRSGNAWIVYSPDGRTQTFSGSSLASDRVSRWNLTSEQDSFGNAVTYNWTPIDRGGGIDYQLQSIDYGSNANAGLASHARVELSWRDDACPGAQWPIGARVDHHFGLVRLFGAQTLTQIRTRVRDTAGSAYRDVRTYALAYDATELGCGNPRSPLRYLTSINVSARSPAGVTTSEPQVTFAYGASRDLSRVKLSATDGLGERGTKRGPEQELMDFDGDGINDLVRVAMPPEDAVDVGCRLFWRKGYFGGAFAATETESWLPSARWGQDAPDGQVGKVPDWEHDACTLNGQYASRAMFAAGSPGPSVCIDTAIQVNYRFLDWDHDGDLDLVTNTTIAGAPKDCGEFEDDCRPLRDINTGNGPGGCPDGTIEDSGDGTTQCQCPDGQVPLDSGGGCRQSCGPGMSQPEGALTCQPDCEGYSECSDPAWFPPGSGQLPPPDQQPPGPQKVVCNGSELSGYIKVWTNEGGVFSPALVSDRIRTNVRLPPNGGQIQVGSTDPTSPPTLPSLVDIDGDGNLDLVTTRIDPDAPPLPVGVAEQLVVYRGTGTGFSSAESWPMPKFETLDGLQHASDRTLTTAWPNIDQYAQAATFADVDADGLPDIVVELLPWSTGPNTLYVLYNQGGSFGPPQSLAVQAMVGLQRVEMPAGWDHGPFYDGWRADLVRIMDVDRDGIPELVYLKPDPALGIAGAASSRAVFPLAYTAAATGGAPLSAQLEPVERLVHALNPDAWYRASDYVDVTGDGRPDAIAVDASGNLTIHTDAVGAPPERLLTSISNGRGATTTLTYAASTDPSIVDTSGPRNAPRWLVRTIAVDPGFGQKVMTTTYAYGRPVYGRDLGSDVEPRLLGFGRVTVDHSGQQGATSARTVTTYAYDVDDAGATHTLVAQDPRGHAVEAWTYATGATAAMPPVRQETSTWTYAPILGGQTRFLYADGHVSRTCDAGANQPQCAQEAENVLTTTETWTPWESTPGGGAVVYRHTRTVQQQPAAGGGVDRRVTDRVFQVRVGQAPYASTDYRILQTSDERRGAVGGLLLARTATTYDDATGLPIDTAVVTVDGIVTWAAHTARTFDPQTGNLLTTRRPNAVASGSGAVTSVAYDANKLYVARTADELGHVVKETRDVGTGALVRREGPDNFHWKESCDGHACVFTAYKPEEWTIDGLGRVVGHRVATTPASGAHSYPLVAAEWFYYGAGSYLNLTMAGHLRDLGGTVYVSTMDTQDGLGRTLTHQDVGVAGAVTAYTYDDGGALASIRSPDPNNDAQVVYTTYTRDGLGRPTAIARPDGSSHVLEYRGLSTTSYDTADGEAGPKTTTDRDPLGRLVAVHEPDDTGDHVTRYGYDAADRMTGIVDADGDATAMTYDLAGRRTSIARGSRVWTYGYDWDGNMTSVRSPVPAGKPERDYTSTTTYDALDRAVAHTPATRGVGALQLASLGVGTSTTHYDRTTGDGVALPSSISLPFGTIRYDYDVHDLLARETRTLQLGQGVGSVAQHVDRTYNLLGAPVDVTFDDGTSWQTVYDVRGLVADVLWRSSDGLESVGAYARHAAGNPAHRTNAYHQRRDWKYDALGRVVDDSIGEYDVGHAPASFARRTYGYDGFGRLEAVTGTIAGHEAGSDFDYDGRGRLAHASVGGTYRAAMTYSPAGNVTHATVSGALDAPSRDVTYEYGAVDPQAVDRLVGANGQAWATLTYDPAGNLATRQLPGSFETVVSDGDDHIRQVSTSGGAAPAGTDTYFFGPGAERMVAFTPEGVKLWFGESETHLYANGAFDRRWFHLAAGEPLARIERAGKATTIELQYADALQNLMLTLSSSSAMTSAFVYGGFGEVVWQAGDATHRRQFNGKEADKTSGLRHYGYRSYDPVLLRWTAGDPLYRFAPDAAWAEPQRANLYAFSLNDPLGYSDPDGRNPEDEKKDGKDEEFHTVLSPFTGGEDHPYPLTQWQIRHLAPKKDEKAGALAVKIALTIFVAVVTVPATAVAEHALREADEYIITPAAVLAEGVGHVVAQADEGLNSSIFEWVPTVPTPGWHDSKLTGTRKPLVIPTPADRFEGLAETQKAIAKAQGPLVPRAPRRHHRKPRRHEEARLPYTNGCIYSRNTPDW